MDYDSNDGYNVSATSVLDLTNYDNSTADYASSGGFNSTAGLNDTGSSGDLWDRFVDTTTTWDRKHWAIGWIFGLYFSLVIFMWFKCLCPQRSRATLIVAMVGFVIGWWVYVIVFWMTMVLHWTFILFICARFAIYQRCGWRWERRSPCAAFKEKRRNARILMERTLSNPAWRRRSWLVIMRARRRRFPKTRVGQYLKWFVFRRNATSDRHVLPLTVNDIGPAIADLPSDIDVSFQQAVMRVVDLAEEGLFRQIVSYL